MNNIFTTITTSSEDEFDFSGYLNKTGCYEIFKPIFETFGNGDIALAVRIVKFILYAYTPESDLLMERGSTWDKMAKHIFTVLDIPAEYYPEVGQLKSPEVQATIQNWLQYLNEDVWANYITFRDLRWQMITHSLSDVKNSNDQLDIKAKMDAAKNAKELLDMMDSAKKSFVQSDPKLKISVDAVFKAAPKIKDTIGPQTFAK